MVYDIPAAEVQVGVHYGVSDTSVWDDIGQYPRGLSYRNGV
jgi:hypothetical protein